MRVLPRHGEALAILRLAMGSLLVSGCSLFTSGCDLLQAARSKVIVSGILAATPEVEFQGLFEIPSEVLATTYVGERESVTSTEEPKPISRARVRLTFAGNRVELSEQDDADGVYAASSIENPGLVYAEDHTYTFGAILPGEDSDEHGGSTEAPRRLTGDQSSMRLTPAPGTSGFPGVETHPKSTDLEVAWAMEHGRYAYVTVLRGDPTKPEEPELVFDSAPKTAAEIIKFIVGDPPSGIVVPAATFDRDGLYAVLLVTMDKGEPKTNTFLGSPILAGSGAARLLLVGTLGL